MVIVTRLPRAGRGLLHDARTLLQCLAQIWALGLRESPLPPLYQSGVRYQPEPNTGSGIEDWACPWDCIERGWGDCDDLVGWRVAEL